MIITYYNHTIDTLLTKSLEVREVIRLFKETRLLFDQIALAPIDVEFNLLV